MPTRHKSNARVVQSILIDKAYAPALKTAKAWVQSLGGSVAKVDETENFWRFRQQDPRLFLPNSYRHYHLGHGVRGVMAIPKTQYRDEMYSKAEEV